MKRNAKIPPNCVQKTASAIYSSRATLGKERKYEEFSLFSVIYVDICPFQGIMGAVGGLVAFVDCRRSGVLVLQRLSNGVYQNNTLFEKNTQ